MWKDFNDREKELCANILHVYFAQIVNHIYESINHLRISVDDVDSNEFDKIEIIICNNINELGGCYKYNDVTIRMSVEWTQMNKVKQAECFRIINECNAIAKSQIIKEASKSAIDSIIGSLNR